jgi:hypothetical protein
MAIFQVLKVIPPRKHQQSPRNFKRSQHEKKRANGEAISKQVQAILKRKQPHEVKGHHKCVPPRSPHKKNLHQPQKQVYKSPRMQGTTGKKAVDSHSPPLAKA